MKLKDPRNGVIPCDCADLHDHEESTLTLPGSTLIMLLAVAGTAPHNPLSKLTPQKWTCKLSRAGLP
jgi:hypothetical protein